MRPVQVSAIIVVCYWSGALSMKKELVYKVGIKLCAQRCFSTGCCTGIKIDSKQLHCQLIINDNKKGHNNSLLKLHPAVWNRVPHLPCEANHRVLVSRRKRPQCVPVKDVEPATNTEQLKQDFDEKIEDLREEMKSVKDVEPATNTEQLKQDFDEKIEDLREEMKSDACPTGRGYLYNSKLSLCYKMYKQVVSRDDANTICESDNGLLISLETQEKYNHIVSYLNSLGQDVYKKGTNGYQVWNGLLSENRGKWIWANGKTTLPRWAAGEPDRLSNRDCGQILAGGNGDILCDNKVLPFMCEIPM